MDFTFARHETFHIRTGWLRKGITAIKKEPHIFLEDVGEAMDILGIGKNMISSLRYWMTATGIAYEKYDSGLKVQKKTELGEMIYKRDQFFEDLGTFWLIHYQLCTNKEKATTWYWFFNHFPYNSFNKNTFVEEIEDYIKREGEELPAKTSLEKDFQVLVNMYLHDPEKNISPEDTLESPFTDLRLLIEEDNYYTYNKPSPNLLPPQILYYCILENNDNKDAINIEELLYEVNSVGRVFNLKPTDLYTYLEKLESMEYINIFKQAGLNNIRFKVKDQSEVLKNYYNNQ